MECEPRDGIARGSSGVLRADDPPDPAAAKRPIIATPRLNLADLLSASRRLDVRASRFEIAFHDPGRIREIKITEQSILNLRI